MGGLALNFHTLHRQYGDPIYLQAILLATQIVEKVGAAEPETSKIIQELHTYAINGGGVEYASEKLVPSFSAVIESIVPTVKYELLVQGRVPKQALGKYDGVTAMMRH